MDTNHVLIILGVLAFLLGLLLIVVSLLILIIRVLRKKKKKPAVIFLVLSLLICAAGGITYLKTSSIILEDYRTELNLQRLDMAEIAEDGSYIFRLDDFSYTDDSGNSFSNGTLSEYRYTVINRWEPWCTPCKSELPDLERLYEDYKRKGINFVGIYTTEEDAETVITEYGLNYSTVLYDSSVPNAFDLIQTTSVPLTCVVDSEGCLVPLQLSNENPAVDSAAAADDVLLAYNDCIAIGTRTYDFWAEKLDALLE